MIEAATLDLRANRHTPWAYVIAIEGIDLTDAAVTMQVRQLPDQSGDPLLSLESGAEIALSLVSGDTEISIFVAEAVMEALPAASEVGQDLTLYYDMHITPDGGVKEVYFRGKFIVIAGVTQ